MRTGTCSSDVILCSSSYSLVENEADTIHGIEKPRPLAETNVQIHTRIGAPRDKTTRHVRHDDCCGYCERYCMDKITHLKRREIEEWRQDVDLTMEATKALHAHRTKKPKLTFLKYTAIGRPDTEPGFRRIKTPKDIRRRPSDAERPQAARVTIVRQQRNDKPQQVIDVKDFLTVTPRGTEKPNNAKSPDPDQYQVALRSPSGTDFSKDSLDSSDSESSCEEDQLPSSQHSYRSSSNRLLNVLTIDDAIQNHRDRLLKNNVLKTADVHRRRKVATVTAPQLSLEGISLREKSSSFDDVDKEHGILERYDSTQEFHLHPDSDKDSRSVSKISTISLSDPPDHRLISSDGLSSSNSHHVSRTPETSDLESRTKPNNFKHMLKAVDDMVVHNGDVSPTQKPKHKPQSKRFRKMNKNLRGLIDKEFLPDPRMAERLQYFSGDQTLPIPRGPRKPNKSPMRGQRQRHSTATHRSTNAGYHGYSTTSSAVRDQSAILASGHTHDIDKEVHDKSRETKVNPNKNGPSNSGGNQFLAMLADYTDEQQGD